MSPSCFEKFIVGAIERRAKGLTLDVGQSIGNQRSRTIGVCCGTQGQGATHCSVEDLARIVERRRERGVPVADKLGPIDAQTFGTDADAAGPAFACSQSIHVDPREASQAPSGLDLLGAERWRDAVCIRVEHRCISLSGRRIRARLLKHSST